MSESEQPPASPSVVPLAGARIPADHGLSGLGLVMQLAGSLFSAITGSFGLIMVIGIVQLNAASGRHADNSATLWVLALATTGVIRSMAHRAAGKRLLYDGTGSVFSGVRRYIGIAAIQTVVWTAFFAVKGHAPGPMLATIAFSLAAWPAALAIMISLPRYKRLDSSLEMPEDKGFEGASILMVILGMTGLVFTLVMLYSLVQQPSEQLAQLPGVVQTLVLITLAIRSVFHIIAGWRGISETHMDRAAEAASRYGDFGVIAAFVASAGLLLIMMATRADVSGVLMIGLVGALLLAWPLIIRKFFSERQFADLLAGGEAPIHRRSPDFGLSSLGWLLLGLGVMAMAGALPRAIFFADASGFDGLSGRMDPMTMMTMMMQTGMRSSWWAVGMAALQIWAAVELIRMTDNHKLVASIYGVIATGVAIYINLPMFEVIRQAGIGEMFDPLGGTPIVFALMAVGLIVPVATLVLVNRKTAPTAQARYRPRAPAPADPR
jgi:hypothetical protein